MSFEREQWDGTLPVKPLQEHSYIKLQIDSGMTAEEAVAMAGKSAPRMLLDWDRRLENEFLVAAVSWTQTRGFRIVRAIRCAEESDIDSAFHALRSSLPDLYVYYWPPKLHRWWSTRLQKRRLPIYGERDIDRAVREALDDYNFGSWLFRSAETRDALPDLEYIFDSCVDDPASASVHELDDVVARGCQCGSYVNPEDEHAAESYFRDREESRLCDHGVPETECRVANCEGHNEELDHLVDPDDHPFARRHIAELIENREEQHLGDETEYYLAQRLSWLQWYASRAVGRRLSVTDLSHTCAEWLPALAPPCAPGVYVIQGAGDFVKIGKAGKSIAERVRDIQTSHPVPIRLLAVLSSDPDDEKRFHKQWECDRSHGEWFRLSPELRRFLVEFRRASERAA